MPTYKVIVHEYDDTLVGHVNVEFKIDNVTTSWLGNNISTWTGSAWRGNLVGGVHDEATSSATRIANNPSDHASHEFTVSYTNFHAAQDWALGQLSLWNSTSNYGLVGNNCVDFANEVIVRARPGIDDWQMDEILTLSGNPPTVYANFVGDMDDYQEYMILNNPQDPWWEQFQHIGENFLLGTTLWKEQWGRLPPWIDEMGSWFNNETAMTPMAIDLDGDGIHTISRLEANVVFDVDGDGKLEDVGWLDSSDGFLALDRDGSGSIENGNELFGGENRGDGVADLLAIDSNGDLLLDSADTIFANLLIWRDQNKDGVSTPNELLSLSDHGISSIDLHFDLDHSLNDNGNTLGERSTVAFENGRVSEIIDVYFASRAMSNLGPDSGLIQDHEAISPPEWDPSLAEQILSMWNVSFMPEHQGLVA